MFFKGRRKTKNAPSKIDEAFGRVYNQINKIDSWDDPKKLEHYILDSCEQIIATTKEVERQKAEYRVVTAYLNDIKTLEELPTEKAKDLKDTAAKIIELDKSLSAARNIKRNITESQFSIIQEEEDDMPAIINRMKESEKYQASVKREMNYLEAEKSKWEIEHDDMADQKKLMQKLSTTVFTSFTAIFILLMVIALSADADITFIMVLVAFFAVASGFGIFLKLNDIRRKSAKSVAYLNQAIGLLNIERMKYVNITGGLDFLKEKYKVESAGELEYVYGQYMERVKDQEKYARSSDDLMFFTGRYERILDGIDIHDRKIWTTQVKAIVNPDDMLEVQKRLVSRRQKIRSRIEENRQMVQNERDEIDRLMREHEHYLPEIQEIIKSVDKLCGTAPRKRA